MSFELLSGAQMVKISEEWSTRLIPTLEPQPILEDADLHRLIIQVIRIIDTAGLADYSRNGALISDSGLNLQLHHNWAKEYPNSLISASVTSWRSETNDPETPDLETRETFTFHEEGYDNLIGRHRFKVSREISHRSLLLGDDIKPRLLEEVELSTVARLKMARTIWRAHLSSEFPMITHAVAFLATS